MGTSLGAEGAAARVCCAARSPWTLFLALLLCSHFSLLLVAASRPAMDDSRPRSVRASKPVAPKGHFIKESGEPVGSLSLLMDASRRAETTTSSAEPEELMQSEGPHRRLSQDAPVDTTASPPRGPRITATRTIAGVNIGPGSIDVPAMLRNAVYPLPSSEELLAPAPAPSPALAPVDSVVQANAVNEQNPPTASLPTLEAAQAVSVDQSPIQVVRQFDGLNARNTAGLNNLPIEPPNPGVCVGGGYVVEVTNLVMAVHDAESGERVGGPINLSEFFGVVGPPEKGMSDPYCIYDEPDTGRFFITVMHYACTARNRPECATTDVFSYVLVAVSQSSNPLDGFMGPFYVDSSGVDPLRLQPYPGLEACAPPDSDVGAGCLGDYPMIGIDQHALWISVNLFSRIPLSEGVNFVGAMLYGVRKQDLVGGGRSQPPRAAYWDWSGSPGFTIVPSVTQATNEHWADYNGTVFLVSSDIFTFSGLLDSTAGVPALRTWAITNTSRIAEGFPGGEIPEISAPVTMYTQALQYPSVEFFDYEDQLAQNEQPSGSPLDARDERLRQVALSGGLLWTCLQTPVSIGDVSYNSLAYFVIEPAFDDEDVYTPTILNQGYVSAQGAHVINGGITATREKIGILTGSIFSTGYFLSPFFVRITLTDGPGTVRIPKLSTEELISVNGTQIDLRTGDYSVATLDERGRAWLVAEYAGSVNASAFSPTNDVNHTINWGTWVMQVDPFTP